MTTDDPTSASFSAETSRSRTDRAERVGERIDDLYSQGRERVQELGSTVTDYVQDRPITSLLLAASFGLLVGIVVSRG